MSEEFSHQDYVTDEKFLQAYNEYQKRYAEQIRESDRVIISMVQDIVDADHSRRVKVLDIGCSTGNLLFHLKHLVPNADYVGGDLARSSLEICRKNPQLEGIDFELLDILDLPSDAYDVVIVNAVLYMFDEERFLRALKSIFKALYARGVAIIYDFAHPFDCQNLIIYETSIMHPEGLRLCFRPMKRLTENFIETGFEEVDFYPFEIPIDLPMQGYDQEVVTYTVNKAEEGRMMFRGALYQPWCHMFARKGG